MNSAVQIYGLNVSKYLCSNLAFVSGYLVEETIKIESTGAIANVFRNKIANFSF